MESTFVSISCGTKIPCEQSNMRGKSNLNNENAVSAFSSKSYPFVYPT